MDLDNIVIESIITFFVFIFEDAISFFGNIFVNIMGFAIKVLDLPIVENGIFYSQTLAFTILIIKGTSETFSTYILHKNGDPDADPKGLVIGVAQAVAVIATLPWIMEQLFIFGTKVARDVANLSTGTAEFEDWRFLIALIAGRELMIVVFAILIVVLIIIIAIQAVIRGAELARMGIIGPVLALNLTSNNTNVWSSFFKELIILNLTQAIQIFMLQGAFSLITTELSSGGLIMVIGWLWVTIKTPKYLQQFSHTTGLTGTVGGGAKQMGYMYLMRRGR